MFSSYIFIILILFNYYSRWTIASIIESQNIKNSLLRTVNLDPTKGLLHRPQRINETSKDAQLEICSCSLNESNQRNGFNKQDLYCSVICDYKDLTRSFENKKSQKVRIAVISFVINDDYFSDESLSVYEKTLRQSFDCIETGNFQSEGSMDTNKNDLSESSDHLLIKRTTKSDSHKKRHRTTKGKPKGHHKHEIYSPKNKHHVKKNHNHHNVESPTLRSINPDHHSHHPITTTGENPFEDTRPRLGNNQPKVCFTFAFPEKWSVKIGQYLQI